MRFSWNFYMIIMRCHEFFQGHIKWGENREPIDTPFHTNVHESQSPIVEDMNRILLFAIYEESLTADRFKVACAYLIHIVQMDPSLRDEAYIQICSQSWKMRVLNHQRRIWFVLLPISKTRVLTSLNFFANR